MGRAVGNGFCTLLGSLQRLTLDLHSTKVLQLHGATYSGCRNIHYAFEILISNQYCNTKKLSTLSGRASIHASAPPLIPPFLPSEGRSYSLLVDLIIWVPNPQSLECPAHKRNKPSSSTSARAPSQPPPSCAFR